MKFIISCDLEEFKRYYLELTTDSEWQKTFGFSAELGELWERILTENPSQIIVLRENNKISGHIIWHPSNTREHRKGDPRDKEDTEMLEKLLGREKDFIELHEIWLRAEYRGKGYGKKFFEFFENFIKSKGYDSIIYYADHPAAVAICRQRGYKEAYGLKYKEQNGRIRTFYVLCLSLKKMPERKVEIVDYDPKWSTSYENEKTLILTVVGHIITAIEHIGSTAVLGLGAKPTIDIMVSVRRLSDAKKCIKPLSSIGYEHQPQHETSMPERRFFRKGEPPKEQHYHLHMVEKESDFWKRHLLFRDYLRTHPETAQEYYKLKKELASKYGTNREGYTEAKTSFIESVVAKAFQK